MDRVEKFFLQEELLDNRIVASEVQLSVKFENFNFYWKVADEFSIKNLSLKVNKGN